MRKNYLEYSLEELIDDNDFRDWILHGTNSSEWEGFLSDNVEFNNKVQKAKELIFLLKDIDDERLAESDMLSMWRNIEHYGKLRKERVRVVTFRKLLRYAAVFLLFTIAGTLCYWYFPNPVKKFEFISGDPSSASGEARLVLPDGEEVKIKNDNSRIIVSEGQKIIIDDEHSVDLSNQPIVSETVKMNEVIIPYGKKSHIVLDDGTVVWLNAGSQLAFPTSFSGRNREVFLQGEAYFDVAHSSGKPFLVNTGDITAKVLGTRFNISAYSSDSEVITVLLEGSVAISDNSRGLMKKETILEAGQKASYEKDTKALSVKLEEDPDFHIAWTDGWFRFSRESLISILKKLERYYNIETVFIEPYVSTDLISGKLDLKDSLEDVMKALSDVAEIDFKIEGRRVIINSKKITNMQQIAVSSIVSS